LVVFTRRACIAIFEYVLNGVSGVGLCRPERFEECLAICGSGKVKAIVEEKQLEDINEHYLKPWRKVEITRTNCQSC